MQLVSEGPYWVHTWPAVIWGTVADAMAQHAAEHGDYGPQTALPPWGANSRDLSCDRCNYDQHRCKGCGEPLPHGTEICAGCDESLDPVIPPWCPLPQGDQALRDVGY